jgi:hypothetical protein
MAVRQQLVKFACNVIINNFSFLYVAMHVYAMVFSDEGHGCLLLGHQRILSLADCRVGAIIEESRQQFAL